MPIDPARRQFVHACRRSLESAGWSIEEVPGRVMVVKARKGQQQLIMGHPRGLAETYQRICHAANVPVFAE